VVAPRRSEGASVLSNLGLRTTLPRRNGVLDHSDCASPQVGRLTSGPADRFLSWVWVVARMPGERPSFPRMPRSIRPSRLGALAVILGAAGVVTLLLLSVVLGAAPAATGRGDSMSAAMRSPPLASPASFSIVNLTANNSTVDVTMAFNISVNAVNVTGGALNASNFTFVWSGLPPFVPGNPGSGCYSSYSINADNNSSVLNCTAAAPGSFTVSVAATNWTTSQTNTSSTLLIVVNALPTLSAFHVSQTSLTVGTQIWFNATGAGGTDSIYSYTGLPIGCSGNTSSFSCSPTRAGIYNVTVEVVDFYGYNSTHLSAKVTVSAAKTSSPPVSTTGWAVIIGIVVVGALITLALLLQARREERAGRMGSEESPPESTEAPGGSPPTGGTPPPPGPSS
jgi:hypothetical protein